MVDGWEDAYFGDFTQGGEEGTRPIVLSYDSSPAFTVPTDGTSRRPRALLDTCFRQVEYAGVLGGADNPEGGRALVDFLLSPTRCRRALPTSMYVFPVVDGVELPAGLGEVRRAARRRRTGSTRPRSPRTATPGSRSGATSSPGDAAD